MPSACIGRPLPADPSSALARDARESEVESAQLAAQRRAIKQIEIDHLLEGATRKIEAARRWRSARAVPGAGWKDVRVASPGAGPKQAPEEIGPLPATPAVRAPRLGAGTAAFIPFAVRVNNTTSDNTDAGQAEESIASWGNIVVVAWNDGNGLYSVPVGNTLEVGYSADGGGSFTDLGAPPGGTGWRWVGDPVVAVNERTGQFWLCGMANNSATTNAVGFIGLTFSGTPPTPTWGPLRLVRSTTNGAGLFDKPWMVANSSTANGNLYISYTHFVYSQSGTTNSIEFQRSTDGGQNWTNPPLVLSSAGDAGRVQGSRPAVGPNGDVYVVWAAVDPNRDEDFFRFRRSTDQGVSFGSEVNAAAYIPNFGTGAPGFNREFGITYPSIAVDRTLGTYRGRIYVAWNESFNHINDLFPNPLATTPTPQVEIESNDLPSNATQFTAGTVLRGAFPTRALPATWTISAARSWRGTTSWCGPTPSPSTRPTRCVCSRPMGFNVWPLAAT